MRSPVLILKIAAGPLHQGNIGIVRSLGRWGVPVYTLEQRRRTPVTASRYTRGVFVAKLRKMPAENVVNRLIDVAKRIGQRPILVPLDDQGSILVSQHADKLRPFFSFPEQPVGLPQALANKRELYYLCRRYGVATAETEFPTSIADVDAFVGRVGYPVVVKAMDPELLAKRAGTQSVTVARNRSELMTLFGRATDSGEPNLMLQEYIPGGPDSIWMFNGYFDAHSRCLLGITGQKLRQHPPYTGSTSLGVCVSNPTVERTTVRFMQDVGYRGILDIGYRFDARDGQYKLLDANPRIGASFRLFVATNGIDVARAMYLDLTGQPVPRCAPPTRRKWMVENHDLQSSWTYMRHGELSLRAWAQSLVGIDETAWFARDDPAPFGVMVGGMLVTYAAQLARVARRARAEKTARASNWLCAA